jgi:hypothetical protein
MEGVGLILIPAWFLGPIACVISSAYLAWALGPARRRIRDARRASACKGVQFSNSERQRMAAALHVLAALAVVSPGLLYFFPPLIFVGVCAGMTVASGVYVARRGLVGHFVWPVVTLAWIGVAANVWEAWLPWYWGMRSGEDLVIALGIDAVVVIGSLGYLVLAYHVILAARFDRDVRDRYLEVAADSGTEAWASGRARPSARPATQEGWVAKSFDRPHGVGATHTAEDEYASA